MRSPIWQKPGLIHHAFNTISTSEHADGSITRQKGCLETWEIRENDGLSQILTDLWDKNSESDLDPRLSQPHPDTRAV